MKAYRGDWLQAQSFYRSLKLFSIDNPHDQNGAALDAIENTIVPGAKPIKRRLETFQLLDSASGGRGLSARDLIASTI